MLLRSGPMEVVLHTLPSESPLGIRQNRVVQESQTLGGRRAPSRQSNRTGSTVNFGLVPLFTGLVPPPRARGLTALRPGFPPQSSTALHHEQMKRRYSRPA
jgi:hypothetical protein